MRILSIASLFVLAATTLDAAEPPLRCIEPGKKTGISQAVIVGDVPLVFTSQVLSPRRPNAETPDSAQDQAKRALTRLNERLQAAGSSLHRSCKLNVYAVDEKAAAAAMQAIAEEFTSQASTLVRPAVSVVVTKLPDDEALVGIDAVAAAENRDGKQVTIRSNQGWESAAVIPPGRKIFIAGQAEKADDVKTATQKTMESLAKTLGFLGRSNEDIVQLKCFVKPVTAASAKDVEAGMKAVLGDGLLPPVVLVEWESSLPIEIELVAYGGPIESGMPAVEYLTPPGMTTSPIYSRVARTASSETIYVSGLFGKPGSSAKEETEQLFAQLNNILKASGSDFRHLAKATYYVSTEDASSQLNALRPNYYDAKRPPAASKALVRGVGLPGRTTTLDMIAVPAK